MAASAVELGTDCGGISIHLVAYLLKHRWGALEELECHALKVRNKITMLRYSISYTESVHSSFILVRLSRAPRVTLPNSEVPAFSQ